MSLSEELRAIISKLGVELLSKQNATNYLSDLGVSRNYPYAIPILKDILLHYGEDIVETYNTQDKPSLEKLLGRYRDKYINMSVYDKDRIVEIFDALAFSLDSHLNELPSNNHTDNDAELVKELEKNEELAENRLDMLVERMKTMRQKLLNNSVLTDEIIDYWMEIKENIETLFDSFSSPRVDVKKQEIYKLVDQITALIDVKEEIQDTNESYSSPPRIDEYLTWLNMELNQEYVIYNYLADDMRHLADKATLKTIVSNKIRNNSAYSDSFPNLVAQAGLGICHHYIDEITNQSFDIAFTNQELTALLKNPMSDAELLEYQVQQYNSVLPNAIDNITISEKIIIENDYVAYIDRIEPYSNMKKLKQNPNLKQIISNAIVNVDLAEKKFFNLVARLGKGLHYHYYSNPPKGLFRFTAREPATIDIFFSNRELRQLLR